MENDRNLTYGFFEAVLDSLVEQLAVIDQNGKIVFVNQSWKSFGINNNGDTDINWIGTNYLECCEISAQSGDKDATLVCHGIKDVLTNKRSSFSYEYPCHSPNSQRWFLMRMAPLHTNNFPFFVITHQNITERKLAEHKVEMTAQLDPLTHIANRRKFDEFAKEHWRLNLRNATPNSIAMIDVDHFKKVNDRFGHSFGDQCLVEIAAILTKVVRRPTELCARYGGEEFIIFFGHTDLPQAVKRAQQILFRIRNLALTDAFNNERLSISVSIGVATAKPCSVGELQSLIDEADSYLYEAKRSGRDQVVFDRQERLSKTLS